jgi:hypothetical protein
LTAVEKFAPKSDGKFDQYDAQRLVTLVQAAFTAGATQIKIRAAVRAFVQLYSATLLDGLLSLDPDSAIMEELRRVFPELELEDMTKQKKSSVEFKTYVASLRTEILASDAIAVADASTASARSSSVVDAAAGVANFEAGTDSLMGDPDDGTRLAALINAALDAGKTKEGVQEQVYQNMSTTGFKQRDELLANEHKPVLVKALRRTFPLVVFKDDDDADVIWNAIIEYGNNGFAPPPAPASASAPTPIPKKGGGGGLGAGLMSLASSAVNLLGGAIAGATAPASGPSSPAGTASYSNSRRASLSGATPTRGGSGGSGGGGLTQEALDLATARLEVAALKQAQAAASDLQREKDTADAALMVKVAELSAMSKAKDALQTSYDALLVTNGANESSVIADLRAELKEKNTELLNAVMRVTSAADEAVRSEARHKKLIESLSPAAQLMQTSDVTREVTLAEFTHAHTAYIAKLNSMLAVASGKGMNTQRLAAVQALIDQETKVSIDKMLTVANNNSRAPQQLASGVITLFAMVVYAV